MMLFNNKDLLNREREMIEILTEVRVLQKEQNKKLDKVLSDQKAVEDLFHSVDDRVQTMEIKLSALEETQKWSKNIATSVLIAVILFFGGQLYSTIQGGHKVEPVSAEKTNKI